MCDKDVLENGGTLKSVPATKTKQNCNEAVDNYPHALEFVPKSIRLQKLCNKAFAILPTKLKCIPECYKIHKLYSGYICFPLFDYILNPNKTHKIYDMFLYMLFNRILL